MDDERVTIIIGALFGLTAGVTSGVAEFELFGVALSDTLYLIPYLGGVAITYATAGSVASLAIGYWSSSRSYDRLSGDRQGLVLLTLALVVGGIAYPNYAGEIGNAATMIVLAIMAGGYWSLAQ